MSANTILTSIVTGGSNSHATVAEEANAVATDFITQGVVGTIGLNVGSGGTGSFCVNADGSPDMGVTIKAGQAYITGTPSGQNSQTFRARASTDYTTYVINANASGSTKYDWIYLSVSAANANNPSAAADNVVSLVTSRSTSNTTDNGTPPTYGLILAVVTVANGASSITNANITDKRIGAIIGSANTSLNTYQSESEFDYVASGLVITGDSYGSTLLGSITSGVIYIGGVRNTVNAVSGHTFGASLDTYVDVLYSSTGVGTIVYTTAANNAASPALAASSIRIGIVVTGGTSIASVASINQGQETKVLPIASSVPYQFTDSLGNIIFPRDPNRRVLAQRQIIASVVTTAVNTLTDATGLTFLITAPANGRKIKLSAYCPNLVSTQVGLNALQLAIMEGATSISLASLTQTVANTNQFAWASSPAFTPSAGTHTYKVQYLQQSAGTATLSAGSTNPAYIVCELV